jgi:hypothetical protein
MVVNYRLTIAKESLLRVIGVQNRVGIIDWVF